MTDKAGNSKRARCNLQETRTIGLQESKYKSADILNNETVTTHSLSCYLYLIPEELWLHIFKMIEKSSDLNSCSKTCSLWKRILSEWSPFDIKCDEIFPMISRFLNHTHLLNCRHVNSVWKKSVDEAASKGFDVLAINSVKQFNDQFGHHTYQWFLDTHLLKRPKPLTLNTVALNHSWNAFFQTSQLRNFYLKFSTWNAEANQLQFTTMNPFISRSVFIYVFASKDENPTYMISVTNALEFLSRFGKHIWSITLGGLWFDQVKNRDASLVLTLRDCLMELPNLKYLDFGFAMEQNPSNFDESQLYQTLCENPLPLLKNLETLRFAPSRALVSVQLYLLEQHAHQLQRLDLLCGEFRDKPWPMRPSPKTNFPVLNELNMDMDCIATAFNTLPIFAKAPLKTVVIEVKMCVKPERMKILIEMISSLFSESLEVVYFKTNDGMCSIFNAD